MADPKAALVDFWADAKKNAPAIAASLVTTAVGVIGGLWAWKHTKKYFK